MIILGAIIAIIGFIGLIVTANSWSASSKSMSISFFIMLFGIVIVSLMLR